MGLSVSLSLCLSVSLSLCLSVSLSLSLFFSLFLSLSLSLSFSLSLSLFLSFSLSLSLFLFPSLVGISPVLVSGAGPIGDLTQPIPLSKGLVRHVLEDVGEGARTPSRRIVLDRGNAEARHRRLID